MLTCVIRYSTGNPVSAYGPADSGTLQIYQSQTCSSRPACHEATADPQFLELAGPLPRNFHRKDELLGGRLCPADTRVQSVIDRPLRSVTDCIPQLPAQTFTFERPGPAGAMSLPAHGDSSSSRYLQSYRAAQGILHNPKSDRRTTRGLSISWKEAFRFRRTKSRCQRVLSRNCSKPRCISRRSARTAVHGDPGEPGSTLHLAIAAAAIWPATGNGRAKTMGTRFFAPASLVSNPDFVEGIFGKGGGSRPVLREGN
jgi:hypothetical protein